MALLPCLSLADRGSLDDFVQGLEMASVFILMSTAIIVHWAAFVGFVLAVMLLLSTGIIVLMPMVWFSMIDSPISSSELMLDPAPAHTESKCSDQAR
jgi:hypothetical protein